MKKKILHLNVLHLRYLFHIQKKMQVGHLVYKPEIQRRDTTGATTFRVTSKEIIFKTMKLEGIKK